MLSPSYRIACEPERDLVRITMSGFFSVEQVQEFATARAEHYAQLRCPPNQHLTLCDASQMRIQTQEVVAAFARVVQIPEFRSRKLAIIVGSSLARIQTQRVSEREGVQLFRSVSDAEEWLFAA